MSDSHTSATPETKNAAPTAHPPVRENQRAVEAEVEQGAITGQRVMRSVGGGSPATPPEQFAGALSGMEGRAQTSLLRQLQRSYGNSYVGRVIQAKLTVNQLGDIYEQEADRMAAQVMTIAAPQSEHSIQREIEPKKQKEKIQMMPSLQLAADGNREVGGNLENQLNSSKGGGSPLPNEVRSFMEPHFGADLSQVRVHTGGEAVQMNRELNAQAFTHGSDVYFGSGKSPGNNELTAHELTHVVQQIGRTPIKITNKHLERQNEYEAERTTEQIIPRSGLKRPSNLSNELFELKHYSNDSFIQRDCDPSTTSCPTAPVTISTTSPPTTTRLPPEVARQLLYATTTLRQVPSLSEAERATLERAVPGSQIVLFIQERDEKRTRLTEKTEEMERYQRDLASPPEHGAPPNQDMVDSLASAIDALRSDVERLDQSIQAALPALNVTSEQELVTLVNEQFPRLFVERAKLIAKAELDQNEAIVQQEIERYGLNACVDPVQRQGLVRAAQDLINRDQEIEQLQQSIQPIQLAVEMPPGGVPDPASMGSSYSDYQRQQEHLEQLQQEYIQRQQQYRLQYPVLLKQNLDLRAISSGSEEQLNNTVGGSLQEILSNIKDTKTNIDSGGLKMWNLRNIVEMTSQDMGVGSNQILQTIINRHFQQEQSDEVELQIGLAALSITAGIIATVATGGLALAAASVTLGIGSYQVSKSVRNYLAESAASNIALDPQIADISRNEPDLFWLVVDIVGVVLDAIQVVKMFNQLRVAARTAMKTGEVAEFAAAARRVLPPAAAERVLASFSRQKGITSAVSHTVEAIGNAFHKADMAEVARRLEQVADQGFHAVFTNLNAQGRVRPLVDKASVIAAFGEESAAHLSVEDIAQASAYFDPKTGILLIKPGSLDSVASTIVHETTHYLQRANGGRIANGFQEFIAEYEAFSMEQRYVNKLLTNAGKLDAVPGDLVWMVGASEEKITAHIIKNYPNAIRPSSFNAEESVLAALSRLKGF
jgi:hypothetical protein